jgi:hypothetical protein
LNHEQALQDATICSDLLLTNAAEDGKEMNMDLSNMRITEVMEEVDRHSRQLARKEELSGN